jgi:hypothetical protein
MKHHRKTLTAGIAMVLSIGSFDVAEARAKSRVSSVSELKITRCIREAAGGKMWLERTLWGLRDQEGGWVGAAVLNTNGSHDLGPLQVNTWWIPRLAKMLGQPHRHVRHWLRYDPCFNVQAARWIFLSGLAKSRDYWRAIGIYHSPTEWRQRRYAAGVAAKLRRRYGSQVFLVARFRAGSSMTRDRGHELPAAESSPL